jgi:hypothetical protein
MYIVVHMAHSSRYLVHHHNMVDTATTATMSCNGYLFIVHSN